MAMLPTTPLAPDDEDQRTFSLSNPRVCDPQPAAAAPPYLYTAFFAALLVLFLLRGFTFAHSSTLTTIVILNMAFAVGVVVYAWLLLKRVNLPLHSLDIAAAELGMLYSLPSREVYFLLWKPGAPLPYLVGWMLMVGLLGMILGYALHVEERPNLVLTIIFLALFVSMSFITMAR